MSSEVPSVEVRATWTDPTLAVARSIIVHGPISRTAIAERLGLSQSTLTRLVKPLIASGLVHEQSDSRPEGLGRPPKPLEARAGSRRFAGIKLTGDEVIGVVVDLRADELGEAHRRLIDRSVPAVVDAIAAVVEELADGHAVELSAVGISLGGSARDGRTVDRAPFLDWHGVALADEVEQRIGVPVVVDNDVIALTAAEHWFGEGRGLHDFAVVTIGAGIGLGLVRADEVARTRDAGLGLAGHVPLDPHGPLCMLGHRGCSTAVLTIPSMCAQFAAATGAPVEFAELIAAGKEGDPRAAAILGSAGSALGRLLALVANLAMVETIVLSGDGLALLDVAEPQMQEALAAERDIDAAPVDLRVDRSDFVRWARGAAAVAIQFALPRLIDAGALTAVRASR